MRKRVVHLIDNLRVGGAEKQLVLFCRHIDPERFEQIVVCMREAGPLEQQLIEAGIRVVVLGKRYKIDPLFFISLVQAFRTIEPDLVMCWLFSANLWGRFAALFFPHIKIIATERVEGDWKRWYHRAIDKLLLRLRTDVLLANSEGVIHYCVEKEKISLEKVRVVFNAIAVRERERTLDPVRQFKKVVSISRLTPQKGVDVAIEVAACIHERDAAVQFFIYGAGECEEQYRQIVRERGLSATVHFMGKDRVYNIMKDADVFFSASRYEGLPNAIMEAMAYGLPIVATDIGGTNELITHGETGLLAPKDDVATLAGYVMWMLADKAQAGRLGAKAKEVIGNKFLITTIVRDLEEVFDELLSGGPKAASTITLANKVIQRKEAELFDVIHPELFHGIEKELLDRDVRWLAEQCTARNMRVCDVGAGTGRLTRAFLEEGLSVTAVELSPDMITQLKEKVGDNQKCAIAKTDVESFLLQNKDPFAIICFSAMLHHVPQYQELLKQAGCCVAEGGFIFISHEPVAGQRVRRPWCAWIIDKVDSVLFRFWLFFCQGKMLPVTDYREADPYGVSGLDEERIQKILQEIGFRLCSFERYSPRKTRLMEWFDRYVVRTKHQFRLIAQKI